MLASSWAADTVRSLNEVSSGRDTETVDPRFVASEPTLETKRPSEDTPTTRDQTLQACFDGDLPKLRALFTELDINSGHPPIKPQHYGQQSIGGSLPFTSEMLEVATRNRHAQIISHIFTIFPTTSVSHSVVSVAVEHKDISIFSILLAHDPAILNREMGDYQGPPLSFAVWGSDPSFANFLLDKGADPNIGGFGPLSNLCLAVRGQPVELIRKMVERGADVDDEGAIKRAMEAGRKDVVECLVNAATRS
ncbi:hypothetical protein MMC16_002989 [Acarospora aff. strigata]|nr:hypothetical protein [Acarospora aff. strigata]